MKRKYTVVIQIVDHEGDNVELVSLPAPTTVKMVEARLRKQGYISTIRDGETILYEDHQLATEQRFKMFLVDPGEYNHNLARVAPGRPDSAYIACIPTCYILILCKLQGARTDLQGLKMLNSLIKVPNHNYKHENYTTIEMLLVLQSGSELHSLTLQHSTILVCRWQWSGFKSHTTIKAQQNDSQAKCSQHADRA